MAEIGISTIIPTHNRADMLAHAIESVLGQEACGARTELIVIDDGSTDHTRDVVSGYPDVRYVQTRQGNAAGTRNVGIGEARGEWIAFLDDDDAWAPHKLRRCMEEVAAHPRVRMFFSTAHACDSALNPTFTWLGPAIRDGDSISEAVTVMYGDTMTVSVIFAHRSVFESVGLFDDANRRAEDQDFTLRVLYGGFACHRIDEPLVYWRGRPSIDGEVVLRGFSDTMWTLRRHAPRAHQHGMSWRDLFAAQLRVRGGYTGWLIDAAHERALAGDAGAAARFRRAAWSASPLHMLKVTFTPPQH